MSISRRVALSLMLLAGVVVSPSASRAAEDEVALSPRLQAIADRLESLTAARRTSADLRLRILYSLSGEVDDERRPDDNGFYGKESITAADLYEQARGSTDPLALDLLIRRCEQRTRTEDRCDRVALARRWTAAEPGNVVAWLALSSVLRERGNPDEAHAAFRRAALAPQWHDHYNDVARLVAKSIPQDFTAPERGAALAEALMKANAGSTMGAIHAVYTNCKPVEAAADCARLVETISRDADTILVVSMTPRMAQQAGIAPDRLAFYQQKADAAQWASQHMQATGLPYSDEVGASALRYAAWLESLIDEGELKRVNRARMEAGVTEAEAASRYVAAVSREHVGYRGMH